MRTFLVAIVTVFGFQAITNQAFGENSKTHINASKAEALAQTIDANYFLMANSIDMIPEDKITYFQANSILSYESVALNDYSTQVYDGVQYREALHSALNKLITKDPKNWLPIFIKSFEHLTNESVKLRDASNIDLKKWHKANNHFIKIIQNILSDNYLSQTPKETSL